MENRGKFYRISLFGRFGVGVIALGEVSFFRLAVLSKYNLELFFFVCFGRVYWVKYYFFIF